MLFAENHGYLTGLKLTLISLAAIFLTGCPITQEPGHGVRFTISEPHTGREGYLYIPAGCDRTTRLPVVLTFHAYSPFGSASRQIREWSSTADKYGLIILAPKLVNSGPKMERRLNRITPSVQTDVEAAMGMLDYALTHTAADPSRIYVTGFSYGGFLMHYVTNLFPDRFAALCSRSCSFNPNILNEDNARQMADRDFPVMIYYTQHDLWYIKEGSDIAIDWYRDHGLKVQTAIIPQKPMPHGWGHFEGRPEMAAEFFLSSTGSPDKLSIIASPQRGTAPLAVNLSLLLPSFLDSVSLKYQWTLDGKPLAKTAQTVTSISQPGVYEIQIMITDGEDRTFTASRKITVAPPEI